VTLPGAKRSRAPIPPGIAAARRGVKELQGTAFDPVAACPAPRIRPRPFGVAFGVKEISPGLPRHRGARARAFSRARAMMQCPNHGIRGCARTQEVLTLACSDEGSHIVIPGAFSAPMEHIPCTHNASRAPRARMVCAAARLIPAPFLPASTPSDTSAITCGLFCSSLRPIRLRYQIEFCSREACRRNGTDGAQLYTTNRTTLCKGTVSCRRLQRISSKRRGTV
jgi:hypothetical protein